MISLKYMIEWLELQYSRWQGSLRIVFPFQERHPPFRSEPWNSDSDYTQAGIQLEVFLFIKIPTEDQTYTFFHPDLIFTRKLELRINLSIISVISQNTTDW